MRISKSVAEKGFGVTFRNRTDVNIFCPFHEKVGSSKSKSCSVNIEGIFNCKGCGAHGNVFAFFAKKQNIALKTATDILKRRKVKSSLTIATVNAYVKRLQGNTQYLRYLYNRGFTKQSLRDWKIGCDNKRITIPIFDEHNILRNVRRYLPTPKNAEEKVVSYSKGFGSITLFPLNTVNKTKPIILCEGEWDCILLCQYGFNALTVTGGVSSWKDSFTRFLKDMDVVIIYDVNDKEDDLGQKVAWDRARLLIKTVRSVKIVCLPLPKKYVGGDITNFFIDEKHSAANLRKLIKQTVVFDIPPTSTTQPTKTSRLQLTAKVSVQKPVTVTLENAVKSEYFYQQIAFQCLVAGKGISPFLPPQTVKVVTTDENGVTEEIEHTFDCWSSSILSLIQCTEKQQRTHICTLLGVPTRFARDVEVLSTFNIEEIFIIPTIEDSYKTDSGPYVIRRCYYIGHGLKTNQIYDFIGYTIPDPKTQVATHILTEATSAQTNIDTFSLTKADNRTLARLFQSKNPAKKLNEIHQQLSEHITHIYGRPDLHAAVDLAFHSVLGFRFDDVEVKKGWLETLLLGDTRIGKGVVTENLCKHYKAGEVVSGENISIAGLIGGLQRLGERWVLVWGKIPLADKRLIVLDEAGALSRTEISKLSRVRSEGVAEITKIISERTTARTRLIWVANPRTDKDQKSHFLAYYNYGVNAVPELIGASEDIARFDFVLILANDEVDSKEINRLHRPTAELKYSSENCHKLLMWVWSRTPDQIVFDKDVTKYIMKASCALSSVFSSKIPLIQGEDVRFKLARLACAIAARLFSTNDSIHLIVKQQHVEVAYNFLHRIYSKRSCGYAQFSDIEKERNILRNPEAVKEVLEATGPLLPDLVDGLLEHQQLTARDISDYAGIDIFQARGIVSDLVRHRALIKSYGYYVKKPAFKWFLRKMKGSLSEDPNVTM